MLGADTHISTHKIKLRVVTTVKMLQQRNERKEYGLQKIDITNLVWEKTQFKKSQPHKYLMLLKSSVSIP